MKPREDKAQQLRLPLERKVRCPDCGGPLVVAEGAVSCPVCGFRREGE